MNQSGLPIGVAALLLFLPLSTAQSQAPQTFDVSAYQSFLDNHQELTAAELLDMHTVPAMRATIDYELREVAYLDDLTSRFQLTDGELSLIGNHGFAVSDRLRRESFGHAFLEIYKNDLPAFVSTDAMLHALHMSYDGILMDVEIGLLYARLRGALMALHAGWPALASDYAAVTAIQPSLNDLDVYLTVALQLLGEQVSPHRAENLATVEELMNFIDQEKPAEYALFGESRRTIDFSQFRPRGHYTQEELLERYFKSMMWLGRTEFYLSAPQVQGGSRPSEDDIQRQVIASFLMLELAERSSAIDRIRQIDEVIRFFVGESDNVTIFNLQSLAQGIGLSSAGELLNQERYELFQATLAEQAYAFQRINSQILYSDPMNPQQIVPPSAFLLMGQRFIIDSFVMGNVVFDRILHQGKKVWRDLPSSLDVLFTLGNDAAARLLEPEIDRYHYAPNLAALRYLIDSYDDEFWQGTLYNFWLQAIRTLNPPNDLAQFPPFMQTGAWWQQKMNTQLSSWAQLRHDNLLYAKQSYTAGITCYYPYVFVEPFPQFYRSIHDFALSASDFFANPDFPTFGPLEMIRRYFGRMAGTMDTLATVAANQLQHASLSPEENRFLQQMLYEDFTCGPELTGWYPRLFYRGNDDAMKEDLVVADVHTQPTDEFGSPVGRILHAGTGPVNLAIIVAPVNDDSLVAFVGPVMSYLEHITMNFERLTDEAWKQVHRQPPTVRPNWTNVYLADVNGARLRSGPALVTSVEDPETPEPGNTTVPTNLQLHQNWPNPFNAATMIRFELHSNEPLATQLVIYDLQGNVVRTLVDRVLPGGHYLYRWDGKNESRQDAASGVYFYRLTASNMTQVSKLTLLR